MRIGLARIAAIAAAVLGLLVVAIVARSSPTHPFVAHNQSAAPPLQVILTPPTGTASLAQSPGGFDADHVQRWPAVTIIALVIAAAGVLIFLLQFRFRWAKHHGGKRVGLGGSALGEPVSRPADEVAEEIDAGFDELERGAVTDAIIACWLRVEAAAGGAGIARGAAETSAEFADRVLGSYGVREAPLRQLAALYREARFSEHPMHEQSRQEARACLDAIRADLGGTRATQ